MLMQASGRQASYYDLVSHPYFHALLAIAFPGTPFIPSPVANCRRIDPTSTVKPDIGWAPPTPFHCDLRYHRDAKFAINFWAPLDPVGPVHGSPTLETVTASIAETMNAPHKSITAMERQFLSAIG